MCARPRARRGRRTMRGLWRIAEAGWSAAAGVLGEATEWMLAADEGAARDGAGRRNRLPAAGGRCSQAATISPRRRLPRAGAPDAAQTYALARFPPTTPCRARRVRSPASAPRQRRRQQRLQFWEAGTRSIREPQEHVGRCRVLCCSRHGHAPCACAHLRPHRRKPAAGGIRDQQLLRQQPPTSR